MRKFFGALWPDQSLHGNVTIWLYPSRESLHIPLSKLVALTDGDVAELIELNRAENIYFGMGLRRPGLSPSHQGTKSDVIALPGLSLDIDVLSGVGGVHTADNLPEEKDEALSVLMKYAPPPSLIVWSGYGWQVHWLFRKPLIIDGPGAIKAIERAFEAFQRPFLERGATRGWHVDSTATIQRVWRVPGFDNLKAGRRSPAMLEYSEPGTRYDLAELVPGYGASSSPAPDPVNLNRVRAEMRGAVDANQNKDAIDAVLAGKSFAESGDRDAAMQRVCSAIVWLSKAARTIDPVELAEVMRGSLGEWAAEPGAEKTLDQELGKAAEKFSRAQEDFRSSEARKKPQLDALEKALRKSIGSTRPEPGDKPGFIQQHAIIQNKTTFHVFSFVEPPRYSHPLTRDEILVYARDAWDPTLIFDLTYLNDKDQLKQKTIGRVLQEYASNARVIVGDMTLENSYFSTDESIFHHAVTPLRNLEPRYDADIAMWLFLLSDNHDKLLDWLAALTNLDRPCCSLYLSGASGSGKNLLSEGASRLWHTGGPTLIDKVIGGFNADIFECPLIYVDEGLPSGVKDISIKLRALIGATSFTSTEKYLTNHRVRGSARLLIGANNNSVLSMGDENMSLEDMKAVTRRFLHLHAMEVAAEWLVENNPGNCLTHHWVAGDLMARHLLWLRDNRNVVPGKRFIVEGESSEIHRRLLMQGEQNGLIFEWIARFVDNPGLLTQVYTTRQEIPLARVGGKEILINTQAVVDGWEIYMKDRFKCPTTTRIGTILRKLSNGLAPGKKRYHDIKPDLVLGWAVENQVGDEDKMKENIESEAEER